MGNDRSCVLVPIIMSVSIDTNLNFNSKHISCTLIQKKTKPHSHTKNKIFIIFFKNNGISGDFSHIKCKSWYKRFTLSMHHRVIGKNCCQFGKRRKVSSFDNKISTSTPKQKTKYASLCHTGIALCSDDIIVDYIH